MTTLVSSENYLDKLTFEFPEKEGEALLHELILYISDRCLDDPTFGATKLNKILYFSDFLSFMYHGEPITGVEYMKLKNGPVPRRLVPIREEMQLEGDIVIKSRLFGAYEQHRVIALRDASLDRFTARDIDLVNQVINALWGKTAAQVSDISHNITWDIAREKDSIPYQASLLSDKGITEGDIIRAQELIEQYEWDV